MTQKMGILLLRVILNDVIDFLLNNRNNLTLFFEILAAVTGLVLFNKYRHTVAKYFIYFLVYIVLMVILGRYTYLVGNNGVFSFLEGTLLERNYWWFTLFWKIVAVVFFGWYYSKILHNKLHKKILKITTFSFIIISLIIILLNLKLYFTNSIPSIGILGALIILQCVYYYFVEILTNEKVLNFHKSLAFYISCAILLFWLIKTPLAFFEPYYRKSDMDYVNLRGYINLFVNTFMYLIFTVGLIVSKPENDSLIE